MGDTNLKENENYFSERIKEKRRKLNVLVSMDLRKACRARA